ncbi:MAG: polysaccharide biosynthesis protein [Roseburia sp.]|nr:polysaccharide biosynthesis protein [Roseburia sp.]
MNNELKKHPIISGALLLTTAGILTRLIGFFYKIFLSREVGAEGMGIYQLIFPITGICFSLTSAGIQTSLSRYVSKSLGMNKPNDAKSYLQIGLFISVTLSLITGTALFTYADFIANICLGEPRCASLLKIISFAYVPCAIHACFNGYFYAQKKTAIPAVSQLLEQLVRVGSVYLIDQILASQGKNITISLAVTGLVFGEIAGMLLSLSFSGIRFNLTPKFSYGKELLSMAVPLTATRLIINLFSSVENVLIPNRLRLFGYTQSESLSVFGVLTGMSLAIIMFPSVITNSVSVILLPTISEAQAVHDNDAIQKAVRRTIISCLGLGFAACIGFLVTGNFIGNVIFKNALAGTFIRTLSWICPFLYLSSTLNSILHGLGYTKATFLMGLAGCCIRILFVYFGIPYIGIVAYLYGLIGSQVIMTGMAVYILRHISNV